MTWRWIGLVLVVGCASRAAPATCVCPAPASAPPVPAAAPVAPVAEDEPPDGEERMRNPPRAEPPPPPAYGDTQYTLAARANAAGEAALAAGRYHDATQLFEDAATRVPESIYFFHLCLAEDGEGLIAEAFYACQTATVLPGVKADVSATIAKIREEAAQRGIQLPTR